MPRGGRPAARSSVKNLAKKKSANKNFAREITESRRKAAFVFVAPENYTMRRPEVPALAGLQGSGSRRSLRDLLTMRKI